MISRFIVILGFIPIILANGPTVEIPSQGKVQGFLAKSHFNKDYIQFTGIPYAKPPTGNRRFELPEKVDPWSGIWYANFTTSCIQVNHEDEPKQGRTMGTEDCLHLNVFVPGTQITQNRDVIVHIHGGGFMFGSSHSYAGPKFIMDREIILVTMNYRLGIFGFISTLDKELPGNLGMKDQVMALQWVKENIEHFGGNPNSITITGLSAGGASVHYHLLSPLSKGLFHKAISASGSALNPWTLQENPVEKANKIGEIVGCDTLHGTYELKNCLKSRNAKQLVEATKLLRVWTYVPFSPLALVVDDADPNPFLPQHPFKQISEGKINDVPWIVSATTAEGLYPVAQFAIRDEYFDELRDNWDEYIAATLDYKGTIPEKSLSEVGKKIKEFYMGEKPVSKEAYTEIIQLSSDRLFVHGLEESALMMSKVMKSPVYFYQYNYVADNLPSFANYLCHYPEKYGVSHGDDMLMIFDVGYNGTISEEDYKMSKWLLDMWTQFAKPGDIAAKWINNWEPVDKSYRPYLKYLYVGSPMDIEMKTSTDLSNKEFWNTIPFNENERLLKKQLKSEL